LLDLNEKDDRHSIATDFITKYNIFMDEFNEMVSYEETKVELNNLLDDLSERLWEKIELKKEDLKKKRQHVLETNDISNTLKKLLEFFEQMVSVEYRKTEEFMELLKIIVV